MGQVFGTADEVESEICGERERPCISVLPSTLFIREADGEWGRGTMLFSGIRPGCRC